MRSSSLDAELFASRTEPTLACDRSGRVLETNAAATAWLGPSVREASLEALSAFDAQCTAEVLAAHLAGVAPAHPVRFAWRMRRADGSPAACDVLFALPSGSTDAIVVTIRPVDDAARTLPTKPRRNESAGLAVIYGIFGVIFGAVGAPMLIGLLDGTTDLVTRGFGVVLGIASMPIGAVLGGICGAALGYRLGGR